MNAPMNKAQLRAHLDAKNPDFGAMIDGLREEFPGIKLAYLKTDEVEIGTPTDPRRLCEMSVSPPVKPVMDAWYKDVELLIAQRNKNLKKPTRRKK